MLYCKTIASPVGPLRLAASDKGLCAVQFQNVRRNATLPSPPGLRRTCSASPLMEEEIGHPILKEAEAQLKEYFAGRRKAFDLPLDPQGSMFQLKAWRELQKIPYGQTISYGEQARRVGDAKKARAVGMANGRNPLAIVVPCHRVIGSTGALTGFGGGLKAKQYLLDLERRAA
ncbi:MAG: methylated-DNA--[protein]-cysteine S-methyltransferase [Pseudomonadota bacterium]|nr:methylated-DNA--[protein]-cysteine S-methyltransferase [Pseudomonadota bacterium]MDE3037927.1 methylated-DNA--[protein]-cysteine S-methyltransferase [Pseudomonadota bacterium]